MLEHPKALSTLKVKFKVKILNIQQWAISREYKIQFFFLI